MINAGIDIGNGYVKALLKNPEKDKKATAVDMPSASAIAATAAQASPEPRITDAGGISRRIADVYNNMEVSVESPLLSEGSPGRSFYIGQRAIASGKSVRQFALRGNIRSKSENDLSAILTLSLIAGKALADYYEKNGHIPAEGEGIETQAHIALSLPIAEYKDRRDLVAAGYENGPHIVTVRDFGWPVEVKITIAGTEVAPEGASAQFAIASKGEKFMAALISNMASHGLTVPEGITPQDIAGARNILGVDIGEGTVNFPLYRDLRLNSDASMTMNKGYGDVMDEVAAELGRRGRPMSNRKKLIEFLLSCGENCKDRPLSRASWNEAMAIAAQPVDVFTEELADALAGVLERSGADVECIYVYGGGATPVQESLYPKILRAIKRTFGEDRFMPVLYLASSYSRYLNRDGLYLLAASSDAGSVEDLSS